MNCNLAGQEQFAAQDVSGGQIHKGATGISQHDFLPTERAFQPLHHLVIGQLTRTDQETFQHPAARTETMGAGLSGQFWYPVLQHFLLVLVVA